MGIFPKYLLVMMLGMWTLTSVAEPVNSDFAAGERNYQASDWDGAISNFSKSIESGYDLNDSYSYRAYAKAKKGDVSSAMADCNRVIAMETNSAGGYYWRSQVEAVLTNGADNAIRDFYIGLKMDPRSRPADLADTISRIWSRRGFKKYVAGDLDGAISCFNDAVYLEPTNAPYSLRGFMKLMQGHFDRAIADAFLALKCYPENTDAWDVLAWARYERGDVAGSVEACKKELEVGAKLATTNPLSYPKIESLMPTGLLCFINGDFAKAADDWSDAISLNKEIPLPLRSFLESWIEKAKEQEAQSKDTPVTNNSPTPDPR